MKNYFEYQDEKSAKFWEINLNGLSVTTSYGKIGTTGQTSEKTFETAEKAQKEYNKLIAEKTKKGYTNIDNLKNSKMESKIPQMFADYETWYKTKWLKKLIKEQDKDDREDFIEDFREYGWLEPLGKLVKVNKEALDSFENANGFIPEVLRGLLLDVGFGTILAATDYEEASDQHEIIDPKNFAQEKINMLSWLNKERIQRINSNINFNKDNFVPFLKLEDCCWVFLANNNKDSHKIYLFNHDVEDSDILDENDDEYVAIFKEFKNIEDFFKKYFKFLLLENPSGMIEEY